MKPKSYTTVDKSTWDRGPWDNEPDKMQWQDEATGLPCLIVRNDCTGTFCGYVGVDKKHPLYRKDYDVEIINMPLKDTKIQKTNPMGTFLSVLKMATDPEAKAELSFAVDVHGGLTFAGFSHTQNVLLFKNPFKPRAGIFYCRQLPVNEGLHYVDEEGKDIKVWWFGFDTAHAHDLTPAMNATMRSVGIDTSWRDKDVYRDIAYVKAEVTALARQLKEMG